jgi:lipoate-protein ligase A
MKILNYKQHKLMEEIINPEIPAQSVEELIKGLEKNINDIDGVEEKLKELDQEDFDNMIEALKEQPLPETLKKYILATFKLFYNDEFRHEYKKLLLLTKDELSSGVSVEKMQEHPVIKDLTEKLENQMANILNINREELKELTLKMFGGIKKFAKSKEDASKITPEDPYGEEEWDDMSDEERMRKAFEE